MFNSNTILNFEKLTKFPLVKYFDDVDIFFKIGFVNISNFYSGRIDKINTKYVDDLFELIKRSSSLSEVFKNNKNKLQTVDYWELIEYIEEIRSKLYTAKNIDKYLRSSRSDNGFNSGYKHNYVLDNSETFEDISLNVLGDKDYDNSWSKIALDNDLKENQYNTSGNKNITIYKEMLVVGLVTSVVDNMQDKKIYGKDIKNKFKYDNDDLVVLNYDDTLTQTINIYSNLSTGDIPQFRSLGINKKLYVGSNVGEFSYSSVIRDFKKTFLNDDLFKEVNVTLIKLEQDNFYFEYNVLTKLGDLISRTTLI